MKRGTGRVNPKLKPPRVLNQDPRRLKRKRVEAGKTLREVEAAGVCSAGHLSDLENGNYSAGVKILAGLAGLYGCEPRDLMPAEKTPRPGAVSVQPGPQERAVA